MNKNNNDIDICALSRHGSLKIIIFSGLLCVVLLSIKYANAQERPDSIPPIGRDIIEKGIKIYDKGNYDEAIKIYNRVSQCDPDYWWACYETALAYEIKNNIPKALQKCEESLNLNPTDINSNILKGNLLDELSRKEEAIEWLKSLVQKYPYHQLLLYNLGVTYLNNNEPEKAEELLLRGLYLNPYHASSHFALGNANFIMGRKAQAYLAYDMAILMNPKNEYVKKFEEAVCGERDSISKAYQHPYPQNADHSKWDYLSGLMNAEIAFKDGFKYDYKLNFVFCRQSVLLFQKMQFDEKDTTLYSHFYIRFFKKIIENNELETFLYYGFKQTENQAAKEWNERNSKLTDQFVNDASAIINSWKEYGFSVDNEKKHQKIYHFDDKGNPESIGLLAEQSKPSREGIWQFIGDKGSVVQKSNYTNNKREGETQLFWPEGNIKQKLNYKNDRLDGLNYTYHPNGVKSGVYPRTNGITDGTEEEYDSSGKLVYSYPYKKGKIDGKAFSIDYENGLSREINYVNNKREGLMTEKWLNSKKKTEALYVDSLLKGPYKKWYANGSLERIENYQKGVPAGEWTSYYPNGTKSEEGKYDDAGKPAGLYTAFDHNGMKKEQITGYKNGEPDGNQIFFFPNGKEQTRLTLIEGRIKHIDCFNSSGKLIYNADETNGELNYKNFFPEGELKTEGLYKDGLKKGIWESFDISGKVITEENWIKGFRSGIQKYYYSNGNLRLTYPCDSGKISGKVIRYFRNGHISEVGYYKKNEGYTGELVTYYSNDSVAERSFFIEDKIAGRRILYSPDGKMNWEETFDTKGEMTGIKNFDAEGKFLSEFNFPYDSVNLKIYFPNGKLRANLTMNDRKDNGVQEYYFPNGKLKSRENYVYGKIEGLSQEWDHYGNLVKSRSYSLNEADGKSFKYNKGKLLSQDSWEMGSNQGIYEVYHPNGKLFWSVMEEDDEMQGKSDHFSPDSTWIYSNYFTDNENGSVTHFNKSGQLQTEKINDALKEIICYYKNGTIAARLSYEKSCSNGKIIIYYPNGKIYRESTYKSDYLEGPLSYYYDNGSIKEKTNWANGNRNGAYTSYFENGKIEMQGNYMADKKQGKWLVYDKSEKLIETLYYANDILYDIK